MAGNKPKKVIAVDLGGTNLRVSLVQGKKIIRYIKNSTPKTKEELLKVMDDSISILISKDVKGIGVGSPGPLENGIIKNPPNLPLKNFNLKKHLEDKFKRKVVIENDVHCVALSEAKLGCKKKNFLVVAFGTGIGGGIIIDGKLYLGENFAGEVGHIKLKKGKFFETLWQETRKKIKNAFGKDILIIDLMKMKDKKAKEILEEMYDYIGMGLASLINIFDPEIVVLNGGIKEAGDPLLSKIREYTKKYVVLPHSTEISWSKLNHPGTMGASLLVSK
ncbi:N-acetyl-D-glucosamine kinase [uncultured archaeon]|nr:N-acetyl-D-glucosamine kinase [uncultured archaeon]